jgi:hypothetical protein
MMADDGAARAEEQTALNVARYEQVYNLCLAAARRTMGDEGQVPHEATMDMARTMFDRFQQDQVELAKQANLVRAAKPLLEAVARSVERRGFLP